MLFLVGSTPAAEPEPALQLLKQADGLRTSNYAEFTDIVKSLDARVPGMSPVEQQYLRYLKGWQNVYTGDYDAAIGALKSLVRESQDPTLQFRSGVTLANVFVLATRYEDAFSQLNQLLALLPAISDKVAREQGLAVIAYLYNQVGEYELALGYAEKLTQEAPTGGGMCRGEQLQLEALYKSEKLQSVGPEFEAGIDACVRSSESTYANLIRSYEVRLHLDQGRYEDAVSLLKEHYDEVVQSRYPRMISEYDALLARAYRQTGDAALVRQFASAAIASGVKNQYTEPLIEAYRLLYLLAKEQGDTVAALAFHEKYAAADKGYLDDVSARQLAYERVNHEALANKLQIQTLNKENQLLQLTRENNRLYIALLITVLGFFALWAYKTKRSQLHFMRLSQQDGLTGITNRPHFIALAEAALENGRRLQQEVCVVLCDLDHFKQINDKHGHASGDDVLRQTVAACQVHLRAGDIFGRFGGEEFGFLLSGCSLHEARLRAEQMRLAIASISSPREGAEAAVQGVSASFGIATTNASGYELRQLLAQADAALYQAKHAGRNRVVLAETTVVTAMAVVG